MRDRRMCQCGKLPADEYQGCRSVYDPRDNTSHQFRGSTCYVPWDDRDA